MPQHHDLSLSQNPFCRSRRSSRLSTTPQTTPVATPEPKKRKRANANKSTLLTELVNDDGVDSRHQTISMTTNERDVPSPAMSDDSNQENKPIISDVSKTDEKTSKEASKLSETVVGIPAAKAASSSSAISIPEAKSSPGTPNLNNIISDVVSKHIRDEEEKLQRLNSEKEEQETKTFLQEWELAEEREKDERYGKLQLLLTKSEMYTKYLLERMDQQKQMIAEMKQTELEAAAKTSGPPPKKERKSHKAAASSDSKESLDQSNLSQVSQVSSTAEAELALHSGCPLLFTGELRPYQIDGLVWLNTMFENGVNGILADEMGLGKTIQCIAAIAHLITMNIKGPYLIVVPLSTLPNWVNEFKRFAPKVPAMLYHGTKPEREILRRDIFKTVEIDGTWRTQPVVCTSYEVAMMDRQYLMSAKWKYLIVDEGHRIKNSQCRLIKELRMYDSTHRVLLTGTPLQNNLSELWSLLNFLLPEVFDDLDSFEYWFKLDCLKKDQQDQLIAEEKKRNILAMLHKIMTPFILRRLKSDVELNLPPKQEVLVYAPLTEQQRRFYAATVDRTITQMLKKETEPEPEDSLIIETTDGKRAKRSTAQNNKVNYMRQIDASSGDESDIDDWVDEIMALTEKRNAGPQKKVKKRTHANRLRMQYPMMQLRKCCNHPYLLSQPIDPETGFCKIDEEVVNSSGKMLLMDAMLQELKKTGHKVLIFSQMTKVLDLIEDYCYIREYQYCRLDGSTDINTRREQMELFNTDPDHFLFLLSTRAGGLGINLVSADTVIIFDSDWNPQSDLQAQDRAHRIGQTNPVMIYRLVCANTIDEQIVERAARKRRLEKMVIHREKFKTGMTKEYAEQCKSITPAELLELLKSQDHDAVVSTAAKKQVISKKELNALLDRSHLVEIWNANKAKAAGKKPRKKARSKPTASRSPSATDMSKVFKVIDDDGRESPDSDVKSEVSNADTTSEVSDGVKSEVSR